MSAAFPMPAAASASKPPFRLTRDQQTAVDAFFDFLFTPARCFGISGTAGTGKTFLMGHLADKVMDQYQKSCAFIGAKPDYDGVVFTATTNKAAEVLSQVLGKDVRTIHSFLNLKVEENHLTGKTRLSRTRQWKIRNNLVVFIDECSMIDQALYGEIVAALPECKLVFVGDHAQMAPVGEHRSCLYDHLEPTDFVTLVEPVRNAGQPALVALCAQLRETVETGVFRPIEPVDGAIYYLDAAEMNEGLHYFFRELDPSCRVLCFTNSRVQDYNLYIRETVRGRPPEPVPGDVMVMAQPYANGASTISVESELEILKIGDSYQFNVSLDKNGVYPILCRDVVVRRSGDRSEITLRLPEDPRQVTTLTKHLAQKKNWSAYFDVKGSFADLRHKSACTVYKAQGSTYDQVFVDLSNIGTSYDAAQVARMLFVAVSRARSTVYFYGRLPGRYHDSQGEALWAAPAPPAPPA
jgi:hypothetical protein